jgi:hypothetical protein
MRSVKRKMIEGGNQENQHGTTAGHRFLKYQECCPSPTTSKLDQLTSDQLQDQIVFYIVIGLTVTITSVLLSTYASITIPNFIFSISR